MTIGRIGRAAAVFGISWLALQTAPAGAEPTPRIGADLRAALDRTRPGETVDVIVHFSDRLPLERFGQVPSRARRAQLILALRRLADDSQGPLQARLRTLGVEQTRRLWMINAAALRAPAAAVVEIVRWPAVSRIVLDREIPAPDATLAQTGESIGDAQSTGGPAEWNVASIGAPDLWPQGFTGTGIVVGIVDSGVDPDHQDLAGRWRGGSNGWRDPYGEHATPHDGTGHGTAVAGILVGGSAGGTAIGVAPDAQWIAAKIFNDAGIATMSGIHDALQWMLDPDGLAGTDDAADVVNNSWGLTDDVDQCITEYEADVQALQAAGIAVVFSAGNSGGLLSSSLSPANNADGFAVGSVDSSSIVAPNSSRGPSTCDAAIYPELVAPGVDIWSADLTFGGVFPDSYTLWSGTSFAAPHVTGALALLRQAFPGATVGELEDALLQTAVELGESGPDNDYGYGLIDLVSAQDRLENPPNCTDADADGRFAEGGSCGESDCDDSDGSVWSPPTQARTVRFGPTHDSLSWTAPIDPGGDPAALRYDVIRSADPSDFVGGGTCVESDDAVDTEAVDDQEPTSVQAWFYLIRAENACGSSLGQASSGQERSARACP